MIVYQDIFNGDEMYNDSFTIRQEGCMDVINAKFIDKKLDDGGIASNADEDAEEGAAGEGVEAAVIEKVIDVVEGSQLVQQDGFTKAAYMAHVKGYLKLLVDYLTKEHPERVATFKVEAQAFVKKVIENFKECIFYSGRSMDTDTGCLVVSIYHDGTNPVFYFFRDGMKQERY
ncbi:translationally-controlled tumor protein, putative [Entamoeba invadens IP1]|uniref:translationally-controlled tumor protein, putative n=1 Tax=Entamoeba invadens IP1 TaxID=370355 RepID=UPI0002C3F13D|nr:translationally-controlled tumor protein, putative [Entamoeba invadens IP1]ELP94221.1 translationally-controlled tumor protein, putative [Entamoeba invadens IP1]|eukprot:XP_004260992.1 translationally-controlled tumor protein, putative [Entamoeba invadens IP1]